MIQGSIDSLEVRTKDNKEFTPITLEDLISKIEWKNIV
jgi:hypothetical protein